MSDDNLSQAFSNSAMTKEEVKKIDKERRIQVTAFVFMIFITLLAFIAVGSEIITASFAVPFILIMAVIQFFLQLYYFMHLKDEDHGWPNAFIVSGIVLSTPAIAALILLLGVVKY